MVYVFCKWIFFPSIKLFALILQRYSFYYRKNVEDIVVVTGPFVRGSSGSRYKPIKFIPYLRELDGKLNMAKENDLALVEMGYDLKYLADLDRLLANQLSGLVKLQNHLPYSNSVSTSQITNVFLIRPQPEPGPDPLKKGIQFTDFVQPIVLHSDPVPPDSELFFGQF